MKVFIILAFLAVAVVAQYPDPQAVPIPYSFNYVADTEDGGKSSHEESGDGAGRVTGSYSVNNLEGHSRVVEYIADEGGFRATIRTNEPGTDNQNPADVTMESSAAGASAGGATTYSAPAVARPAAPRPAAPGAGGRPLRYILVPIDDPRAAGYV